MKRLGDNSSLPYMIGRYFNKITRFAEKTGGSSQQERHMQDFWEAMDMCGLIDLGFIGSKFTWCNHHVNSDTIWERLDWFLLNNELQEKCSLIKIHHLAFLASDQRSLQAEWQEDMNFIRHLEFATYILPILGYVSFIHWLTTNNI